MKKVLVTGASNIGKAGVATILYNWGQNFDRDSVVYDYLAQRGLPDKEFQDNIALQGGQIFVPNLPKSNKIKKMLNIIGWIEKVLKENKCDVFHINSDSAYLAAIYIAIAKRAKIKHIIVHSHSTMIDDLNKITRSIKIAMHYICRGYVRKNAEVKLACSKDAGKWMFASDTSVTIPNGIALDKFEYDEQYRNEQRKELGIEDKFAVGCVGRLSYTKNHLFSIKIFQEILKQKPDSVFLIIGEGEERHIIEQYVRENNLTGKVILLGNRFDVNKLLSCIDVFLLPSRFEGLGIVYIEAQASGMPVFASDVIPEEAFVTDLMHKHSLNETPKQWADDIISCADAKRKNVIGEIEKAGYSIRASAQLLQSVYMKIGKEK